MRQLSKVRVRTQEIRQKVVAARLQQTSRRLHSRLPKHIREEAGLTSRPSFDWLKGPLSVRLAVGHIGGCSAHQVGAISARELLVRLGLGKGLQKLLRSSEPNLWGVAGVVCEVAFETLAVIETRARTTCSRAAFKISSAAVHEGALRTPKRLAHYACDLEYLAIRCFLGLQLLDMRLRNCKATVGRVLRPPFRNTDSWASANPTSPAPEGSACYFGPLQKTQMAIA